MRILGIKPEHDGGSVILDGGCLVACVEAEKDSHPRHSPLTAQALAASLDSGLDTLAVGGWYGYETGYFGTGPGAVYSSWIKFLGRKVNYFSSSHERSHIWSSYALSPFEQGRPCYVLIWEGQLGKFYHIDEGLQVRELGNPMTRPGHRYSFLFELADAAMSGVSDGGTLGTAGKMMALCAYANRLTTLSSDQREVLHSIIDDFDRTYTCKERLASSPLHNVGVETQEFKDLACALSDAIFDRFYVYAKSVCRERLPLLIGGGCGLNCDWNTRWRNSGLFTDVFVPPCATTRAPGLGQRSMPNGITPVTRNSTGMSPVGKSSKWTVQWRDTRPSCLTTDN